MKKLQTIFIPLILLIILVGAKAPNPPAKSSSLEIKGYVYIGDDKVNDAEVRLYQDNKIVQKAITKKSKFQFILFSDMRYMVEVHKEGYVTERIQISTKEKTEFAGKYLYEFKVDLMSLKKFKGVDISSLDFPTAIIKYDAKEGEYLHDLSYSQQVKDELKKLKTEAKKK